MFSRVLENTVGQVGHYTVGGESLAGSGVAQAQGTIRGHQCEISASTRKYFSFFLCLRHVVFVNWLHPNTRKTEVFFVSADALKGSSPAPIINKESFPDCPDDLQSASSACSGTCARVNILVPFAYVILCLRRTCVPAFSVKCTYGIFWNV